MTRAPDILGETPAIPQWEDALVELGIIHAAEA
jgi:hypothetical protein